MKGENLFSAKITPFRSVTGDKLRMHPTQTFLTEIWQHLWSDRRQVKRVAAAAFAILISVYIGVMYGDEAFITIFPILFWLWSILICFAALYTTQKPLRFHFTYTWVALIALSVIAFFLRIFELRSFPIGFHPDEERFVGFALQYIFNPKDIGNTLNPFRTGNGSQPFLYTYVIRLSVDLFGLSTAGARISSVITGALAVAAVFLMVNEMAGRRIAWLTAIVMTTYHYHIHWSRLALNNIWVTLLLPCTFGFFLLGWRKSWKVGALLAGICLGSVTYFYAGGYIVVLLILIIIWRVWKKTEDHTGLAIHIGKMLILALVIAAPLIIFAMLYPQHFFDRVHEIYGWYPETVNAMSGNSTSYWDYFIFQVIHSFGAYNFYPDITGFYAPAIPFLIGVSSILFPIGVVLAIYKKHYIPLIWVLIVTILGGVMSLGTPGSSHFIGVIPGLCWLVAIPLDWLIEHKYSYLAYFLLVIIVITDLSFYFIVYAAHPSLHLNVPFPVVEPFTY